MTEISKTHGGRSIGSGQEHYRTVASHLDQAVSLLIALSEEKHIAALSNKHVSNCVNAIHSLVYDADLALGELWKCVRPANVEDPSGR